MHVKNVLSQLIIINNKFTNFPKNFKSINWKIYKVNKKMTNLKMLNYSNQIKFL